MNMTVINKSNNERYNVYDVTYNNAGYPHFLIYKDGQWIRMSAKYFRPIEANDLIGDGETPYTYDTVSNIMW